MASRICFIASYSPSLINFRGKLLQRMVEAGHKVTTLSPAPDTETLKALARIGVKHKAFPMQRMGMNPLADMRTFQALSIILRKLGPDHVLSYTIKPVIYGSLAAAGSGVPHVHALITGLGTAFQGAGPKRSALNLIVQTFYRRALGRSESVIFQNPDDRTLFLERNLVEESRTHLISGSGVDLDHFQQVSLPSSPHFLLISRLIADKGVREYVTAAKQVKQEYPEATFSLVGYHEDHIASIGTEELQSWIKSGIINFLGRQEDVRPALAASSVYVLPSYREGLPRTVLEAMAMGRPVITTDAPGCRETVISGKNGFLVPVRETDSLAHAMSRFCRDPDLAPAMGRESRKLAEARFDVHKVNGEILQILGLEG